MTDTVAESGTPTISLASSARIIEPMNAKKAWVFKTPQTDTMMVLAILEHAAKRGMKTMAYIGFSDALGEAFYAEFEKFAAVRKISIVANERFASRDTSVTAQIIKLTATNPDMVVIGASGTPAVLPAKALAERGYKGSVYFNHGVANNDFLRVGGKDVEGAFVPTSPVIVAAALPADHPAKAQAVDYVKRYEAMYGPGTVSAFGAYTWDAGLLLSQTIPVALKTAQPGSREFRAALRDALDRYAVLVLPGQSLDYAAQIAFSQGFGALEMTRPGALGAGSAVIVLSNIGPGGEIAAPSDKQLLNNKANRHWHHDS
jgi:branched-chain amino acid transport system substrate-binding protein